jgi:hypothetical protein
MKSIPELNQDAQFPTNSMLRHVIKKINFKTLARKK